MGLNLGYPYFGQKYIDENIEIAYYMQRVLLHVIGYFNIFNNPFLTKIWVPQIQSH